MCLIKQFEINHKDGTIIYYKDRDTTLGDLLNIYDELSHQVEQPDTLKEYRVIETGEMPYDVMESAWETLRERHINEDSNK